MRKHFTGRKSTPPKPLLAPEHLAPLDLSPTQASGIPVVVVKAPVRNPTLYRKRLGTFDQHARPGDLVQLTLTDGSHFGYGLFNSRSEATVRVLSHTDVIPDVEWWQSQLRRAIQLRHDLFGLPGRTNAYRVVHAEGDGLPGLVIDRYDNLLSAECFSLGMYRRCEAILHLLQEELGTQSWRIATAPQVATQEGFTAEPRTSPGAPHEVEVSEQGVRYGVDLQAGHKTGFFCDQRENRARIAALAGGKTVLDLCCYTGGFALSAAVTGQAADVTGVDLDETAISTAKQNAARNQAKVRFVHADAFPYMRDMLRNERQYDLVILDPPKLISQRNEFDEGRKKYFDLNRLAAQLVAPGGLLLTCSCSGLMPADEFAKTVAAAIPGSRRGQFLYKWGAAGDHPVATSCPESEYLKAYLVRVHSS